MRTYFSTKDTPEFLYDIKFVNDNPIIENGCLKRYGFNNFKNSSHHARFPYQVVLRKFKADRLIGLSLKHF